MRPPQNAGESKAEGKTARTKKCASMRPPQNAGESRSAIYRAAEMGGALQ